MHSIKGLPASLAALALLAVAGCTSMDGPKAVEEDFGNSVRQMRQAQMADPSAPADNDPIDHGDGAKSNAAIDVYRKTVSDPATVKEDMIIGVDD